MEIRPLAAKVTANGSSNKTTVGNAQMYLTSNGGSIVKITDKVVRNDDKTKLVESVLSSLEEKFPERNKDIKDLIDSMFKNSMREMILSIQKH